MSYSITRAQDAAIRVLAATQQGPPDIRGALVLSIRWNAAQKYVVAVVLVPLSHVTVTVQFLNRGTAGTILRS